MKNQEKDLQGTQVGRLPNPGPEEYLEGAKQECLFDPLSSDFVLHWL